MSATLHGFGAYSLRDIQSIFDLSKQDLSKKILLYGAGASYISSSYGITCADPLYQSSLSEIKKIIELKYQQLETAFQTEGSGYLWNYFTSPQQALSAFQNNSTLFLEHFSKQKTCYIPCALPNLPFPDNHYDLVLCLDKVFAAPMQSSLYLQALSEFKRIAHEIRIFPLTDAQGKLSSNLGPLILKLQTHGFGIEIKHSLFTFQPQADAVLRIWPQTCTIPASNNS